MVDTPDPYRALRRVIDAATTEQRAALAASIIATIDDPQAAHAIPPYERRILAELAGALLAANDRDRATWYDRAPELAAVELDAREADLAEYHATKRPPTGDEPPPPPPVGKPRTVDPVTGAFIDEV